MNVTAVHTGTAFPFTAKGRYFHSFLIVRWIFASYGSKPELLRRVTVVTLPLTRIPEGA